MEVYKSYFINALFLIIGLGIGVLYSMKTNVEGLKVGVDFGGKGKIDLELNSASIDHIQVLEQMFSKPFSIAGTKFWLKEQKEIYDLHDTDLCKKISSLDYEDELCKNLRDIFDDKKGPFAYQSDSVSIGFPGTVGIGLANVPFNSKYAGKKVEITSRQYATQVVVVCVANYPCTGALSCPDMQISHEDAHKLFKMESLPRTHDALATVIQQ